MSRELKPTGLGQIPDPMRPKLPERPPTAPPITTKRAIRLAENLDKTYGPQYDDPVAELKEYVEKFWVQQLVPIKTRCWRCRKDSPIVYVPQGAMLFGTTPKYRGQVDVTRETIAEFAKVGWKFQLRKSYCPDCKNLGAI